MRSAPATRGLFELRLLKCALGTRDVEEGEEEIDLFTCSPLITPFAGLASLSDNFPDLNERWE